MAEYIKSSEFIEICYQANFHIPDILTALKKRNPSYHARADHVERRIQNYRRKGLLPLDSGNSVSSGELLKGTSTLYAEDGSVKLQWVKTDVPREQFLEAFTTTIEDLASNLPPTPQIAPPLQVTADLATLYVCNDLHLGALMWDKESGKDWNLDLACSTIRAAYDYLFSVSPNSEVGIVVDLGEYRRLY